MPNPLLSTYRTGENRVTSSTMAVFERVDLALVQELLEAATGGGGELRTVTFENQTVTFKNQVVNEDAVPDARISARFTWWFETKTSRGGYASEGRDRDQVRKHSGQLVHDPEARLFVLTPDPFRPQWFDVLDGVEDQVRSRIVWLSFHLLADAINAVIADPTRLVGEQTKFLLVELVALYESDGLLTNDDTVIVAARAAWPEYKALGAYVCQANRSFREGLTHFGFYAEGAIQPVIARIRAWYPSVSFTREEVTARRADGEEELAILIEEELNERVRTEGESFGVFLLSGLDSNDTVPLNQPIVNDTKTVAGRTWAWTLSQRYTRLERLTSGVTRTSEL
jgi:hypothetical protein